jgi:hypothetical protein
LTITPTGDNRNDITQLIPLIDALPAIRSRHGRPWRRPAHLHTHPGNDHDRYCRMLRARSITPVIARHGSGPGELR